MSEPITPIASTKEPRKKVVRRRKKRLTPKQKLVKDSAEQRFKIENLVFIWQEKLFSQAKTPAATLQRAVTYLQPKTFAEVVEERVVQEWCGYPLCDNAPKTQELQKYKISLSQRKVYDQTELANYCSEACYHKSKYYIMQLSEEPVWFRDLNVEPTARIILLEEDFKTAVNNERKKTLLEKSSQEIRSEYVQHLLANVPKDKEGKFEIVEKSTVPPPAPISHLPESGVYDSIEGYRIEIKKNGKKPTTMILKKKNDEELKQEQQLKEEKERLKQEEDANEMINDDDPDALFETMMMLKDMNMDKEDQLNKTVKKLPEKVDSPLKPVHKQLETVENTPTDPSIEASKHVKFQGDVEKKNPNKPMKTESIKEESNKKTVEDTNVIQVTAQKTKKPAKKKKKHAVPELSLFGTIWTILDHMTTKATRIYLTELQNKHQRIDITSLLKENGLADESIYLRGQILSERILDTYGIIRTQLDIKENLEDDIVNVIKTFNLSDASMVALNPAQCYMVTLVLIKSLADILVEDSIWKNQFELCCKTIDQSTDMVDACVRVLKVASV